MTTYDAWLNRVRATWNERAAEWDDMSEAHAAAPDRPADVTRIATALRLKPGSHLLDAGCGSGQWAIAFAQHGCRVTAVDLAPEMVARARRHAAERGVEIEWRVGEVARLTDRVAVYDAIFARVVLQFVPDVPAALRELRRVLKPGGRLLASVPGALSPIYANSWRRFVEPESAWANFMVPWELEELLRAYGWTILDSWGYYGGRSLSGDVNPLDEATVAPLDRRLQQAAATTWVVIAK